MENVKENMEAKVSERAVLAPKLNKANAVKFSAMLRAAGVSTDLASAAVMYETAVMFLDKGTNVTVQSIGDMVEAVMNSPEFQMEQPKQ